MSDIGLTWEDDQGAADFTAEENDLVLDDGLETAILLSLYLDRRADAGDVLPSGTDRRGWWGDSLPRVAGDKIGSRLWLLDRAKETTETLQRAEEYIREALAWLVEDRVADKIEAAVSFPARGQRRDAVSIYRPGGQVVNYRFDHAWAAQVTRGA
jgi:phage gp46-like protein